MPTPKMPRSAARGAILWPTGISEGRVLTGNTIQAIQNGQVASLHPWILCVTYTVLELPFPMPLLDLS